MDTPEPFADKDSDRELPRAPNRREFLEACALGGLACVTAFTRAHVAQAADDPEGKLKPDDGAPTEPGSEDIKKALDHPEKYIGEPWFIDLLLTLNFSDAVLALAKNHHGQPITNRLATEVVNKISGGKLGSLSANIQQFDRHFPHTSILTGIALNILRAQHSEHSKHEVMHGFQEAGMGVGMLLAATSVGAGIRTREQAFMESIELHDRKILEGVEEDAKHQKPAERINEALKNIPEIVGAAPFAAALCQVPLLAFGNARIAREKMLSVNRLSEDLFGALEGLHSTEVLSILSSIENDQVAQVVRTVLDDIEYAVTAEHCSKMRMKYMEDFGVGMLSGNMDVTQAGFGDVGPAVVGAYQSFGTEEMLKTGLANCLYAVEMGVLETKNIARRLGVPIGTLLGGKALQEAGMLCINAWKNLFAYAAGFRGSPQGARFGVLGQVGDDLEKMFRMGTQAIMHAFQAGMGRSDGIDDILTRKGMHILREEREKRTKIMDTIANTMPHTTAREAQLRSMLTMAGVITLSEALDETLHLDEILSDENKAIVAKSSQDIEDVLQQAKGVISREQLNAWMLQVEKFQDALHQIKCNNPQTQKDLSTVMEEVLELFEKEPAFFDLFNIEYWEMHVGSEMAETAFVVFLQGIHVVGLTPTISRITYRQSNTADALWEKVFGRGEMSKYTEKDAGFLTSMMIHGGMSSIADNWADEIIHARQLCREVLVPQLFTMYGTPNGSSQINTTAQNITGQFMQTAIILGEELQQSGKQNELEKMYNDVYESFLITKFMAIVSAVFGGGESVIGNSPHFTAIVEDLKKMITLGASFADIYKRWDMHAERLAASFVHARYIGPMIERRINTLYGINNPFHPENRKEYTLPADYSHSHKA